MRGYGARRTGVFRARKCVSDFLQQFVQFELGVKGLTSRCGDPQAQVSDAEKL